MLVCFHKNGQITNNYYYNSIFICWMMCASSNIGMVLNSMQVELAIWTECKMSPYTLVYFRTSFAHCSSKNMFLVVKCHLWRLGIHSDVILFKMQLQFSWLSIFCPLDSGRLCFCVVVSDARDSWQFVQLFFNSSIYQLVPPLELISQWNTRNYSFLIPFFLHVEFCWWNEIYLYAKLFVKCPPSASSWFCSREQRKP